MQDDYIKLVLKAADKLALATATWKKWSLYTMSNLQKLQQQLTLTDPCDTAIWACITILFFGLERTGELTVKAKTGPWAFHKDRHPTMGDIQQGIHQDMEQLYMKISLPWSKVKKDNAHRDYLSWIPQGGEVDP